MNKEIFTILQTTIERITMSGLKKIDYASSFEDPTRKPDEPTIYYRSRRLLLAVERSILLAQGQGVGKPVGVDGLTTKVISLGNEVSEMFWWRDLDSLMYEVGVLCHGIKYMSNHMFWSYDNRHKDTFHRAKIFKENQNLVELWRNLIQAREEFHLAQYNAIPEWLKEDRRLYERDLPT